MGAVIVIRDRRSRREIFPTRRSSSALQPSWSSRYDAAVRFDADEVEEEVQFWRELLDDPEIEVAVLD